MDAELLAGLRVLVVDDDCDVRRDVRNALLDAGVGYIHEASSCDEAIGELEFAPTVMVVDVNLGPENSSRCVEAASRGLLGRRWSS